MRKCLMTQSTGRILRTTVLMLLAGVVSVAQSPPQRVNFARGRSSATVSDSVPPNHVNSYVLYVKSGQQIRARVRSANGKVDLDGDNISAGQFEESGTTTFNVPVDQTGDYRVYVRNRGTSATRCTLNVTVR